MIDYYIKFTTSLKDSYLLKVCLESEKDAIILQELLTSDIGTFCGRGIVMTGDEVSVLED